MAACNRTVACTAVVGLDYWVCRGVNFGHRIRKRPTHGQRRIQVKKEIHPDYVACTVSCACGNTFETRATKPEIKIDICSNCHPFYTGKQKLVDSEGRVDRFMRKYGKAAAK